MILQRYSKFLLLLYTLIIFLILYTLILSFREIIKPIEPQTGSGTLKWPPQVVGRRIDDGKTTELYEPRFPVGGTQCTFKFGFYERSHSKEVDKSKDEVIIVCIRCSI